VRSPVVNKIAIIKIAAEKIAGQQNSRRQQ
jgi:hypothetical protein